MSALTEREIFSKLEDGFKEAVSLLEQISRTPLRGRHYRRLIPVCDEIEGSCRQACHWRENYHWLKIGMAVHNLRCEIGNILRGTIKLSDKARAKESLVLAAARMRGYQRAAAARRDRPHGMIGQVLPKPVEDTLRQRAVQVPRTAGGVFLPEGHTLQ